MRAALQKATALAAETVARTRQQINVALARNRQEQAAAAAATCQTAVARALHRGRQQITGELQQARSLLAQAQSDAAAARQATDVARLTIAELQAAAQRKVAEEARAATARAEREAETAVREKAQMDTHAQARAALATAHEELAAAQQALTAQGTRLNKLQAEMAQAAEQQAAEETRAEKRRIKAGRQKGAARTAKHRALLAAHEAQLRSSASDHRTVMQAMEENWAERLSKSTAVAQKLATSLKAAQETAGLMASKQHDTKEAMAAVGACCKFLTGVDVDRLDVAKATLLDGARACSNYLGTSLRQILDLCERGHQELGLPPPFSESRRPFTLVPTFAANFQQFALVDQCRSLVGLLRDMIRPRMLSAIQSVAFIDKEQRGLLRHLRECLCRGKPFDALTIVDRTLAALVRTAGDLSDAPCAAPLTTFCTTQLDLHTVEPADVALHTRRAQTVHVKAQFKAQPKASAVTATTASQQKKDKKKKNKRKKKKKK